MINFLGKDEFIWWVGSVENRMDPLGLGRCQVRIFGWHTDGSDDSIQKIPSQDLPWALPILPCNNSKSFSSPEIGEWVVGFFFDGMSGQFPVMFGVIPGILPTEKDKSVGGKYEPFI
jgi:hypothetical protein